MIVDVGMMEERVRGKRPAERSGLRKRGLGEFDAPQE